MSLRAKLNYGGKALVRRQARMVLNRLPGTWRKRLLRSGLHAYLWNLENCIQVQDAMTEALELDNTLYRLIGRLAKRAEGGLHPKHRLINYHAFFTERIAPHERVLDIGCGNGALTYDVAGVTDAEVVGIDLSAENMARAQKAYQRPNLQLVQGDVTKGLPKEQFDVLILSNVWEHIGNRVGFMCTALVATGAHKVLIRVPMFKREWLVPYKKEMGVDYRLDPTHCTEFTEAQLRRELAESGLVLKELIIRWGEFWCRCTVGNEKD